MTATQGRIGPNAILQLLPVIERIGGTDRVTQMLIRAGITRIPDGSEMIPETEAARLHRQLRLEEPEMAPRLAAEAGRGTARYILAHRIPKSAQIVLQIAPPVLSARMLARAIARHAWTFAGSGVFRTDGPWTFEIANNPIVEHEHSAHPLCQWHAAVFEELYRTLVHPRSRCRETCCRAQGAGNICRFEISTRP